MSHVLLSLARRESVQLFLPLDWLSKPKDLQAYELRAHFRKSGGSSSSVLLSSNGGESIQKNYSCFQSPKSLTWVLGFSIFTPHLQAPRAHWSHMSEPSPKPAPPTQWQWLDGYRLGWCERELHYRPSRDSDSLCLTAASSLATRTLAQHTTTFYVAN